MSELWNELAMKARLFYTVLLAVVFTSLAAKSVDITGGFFVGVMAAILLMSFVNEFVLVRHLVNRASTHNSKLLALLLCLSSGAGVVLVSAYAVYNFAWQEPLEESMNSFRYLFVMYFWGSGMFIAMTVVRRSLWRHMGR